MPAAVIAVVAVATAAFAILLSLSCLARRRSVKVRASAALVMAAASVALSITSGALWPVSAHAAAAPTATSRPTPTPTSTLPTWTTSAVSGGRGYPGIARLRIPLFPAALQVAAHPVPGAPEPRHGEIGSVVIPATTSRFVARPAVVYLPPAALVPRPVRLPVIVMLTGQSRGSGPADLVRSGNLRATMDRIAAHHHGVAPIVVVPDQLGPASANPMCVDSRTFGNAATYVLHDVRDWILSHLPVETDRKAWTVAGFSEGGTCAIQFAAGHPEIFGSLVDASGEIAPVNGSLRHTIEVGFGGSTTAYLHATPAWLLSHHRYPAEQAYFAAGALDKYYGRVAPVMAARARAAGMTTHLWMLPGLRHNWRVGSLSLAWGFDHLVRWWGI
ncbi:MAG: hypothetical protein HIU86_03585 [Acidobacteria bacterium]|nr:hypothetical protein [Acidobacteriota bacterium]